MPPPDLVIEIPLPGGEPPSPAPGPFPSFPNPGPTPPADTGEQDHGADDLPPGTTVTPIWDERNNEPPPAGPGIGVPYWELLPDTGGPPIPAPDPGSVDWTKYGVTYPGDGPVLIERANRRRVGRLIPRPGGSPAMPPPVPRAGSLNIVEGERTFGGPRVTPFPNDPISAPAPLGSRGPTYRIDTRLERSDEFYRRQAERVLRDSAIRQLGRVIEGEVISSTIGRALGPIGAAIGSVIIPGELGGGEMIPGLELPLPAPPDIPAPVISQPEVPTWDPIPTSLPVPLPAPPSSAAPTPTAPPSGANAPTGSPGPAPTRRPAPTRAPSTGLSRVPWWSLLSRIITGSSPQWSSPTSWPSSSSLTSSPAPSPAPSPMPSPVPTPTPLTGVEPQVSSSAPPWIRTTTQTREDRCRCPKPKKRKKARDCIVRGQLMWTSGPKKGKPAGSRCVKF